VERWSNFFLASGGAAAALTGLLFIAVSLRPREIRQSPLMVGRARSAFYGFAAITFVALLALAGTSSRLIGVAQLAVAAGSLVCRPGSRGQRTGRDISTSGERSSITPVSSRSEERARSAGWGEGRGITPSWSRWASCCSSASRSATPGSSSSLTSPTRQTAAPREPLQCAERTDDRGGRRERPSPRSGYTIGRFPHHPSQPSESPPTTTDPAAPTRPVTQ
jgi:hypothetical protein